MENLKSLEELEETKQRWYGGGFVRAGAVLCRGTWPWTPFWSRGLRPTPPADSGSRSLVLSTALLLASCDPAGGVRWWGTVYGGPVAAPLPSTLAVAAHPIVRRCPPADEDS